MFVCICYGAVADIQLVNLGVKQFLDLVSQDEKGWQWIRGRHVKQKDLCLCHMDWVVQARETGGNTFWRSLERPLWLLACKSDSNVCTEKLQKHCGEARTVISSWSWSRPHTTEGLTSLFLLALASEFPWGSHVKGWIKFTLRISVV